MGGRWHGAACRAWVSFGGAGSGTARPDHCSSHRRLRVSLPEGPLGDTPENPTVVSQPVLHGGPDTIGFDAVTNSGSAPAVIDRVVIRSPRHIKLIGAYVTVGGIVGDWTTFLR